MSPPRRAAGLALRRAAHRLAPSATEVVLVWSAAAEMGAVQDARVVDALVTSRARLRRDGREPGRTARRAQPKELTMFDALEMSLQVLQRLVPVETRIRRKSASLAKQLADASESVALNLGEGRLRRDGDKRRHFEMAAGSASEVTVALRIAVAKGYITPAELAEVDAVLDRVRAILYRLTR
jgi:four helix bundle protein